ncbi:Ig-like domain-containing protein [Rufibacter quisquiliarum]|uniref:Gliding motility-associated-like protein n=1 Tax=Rufibacter quisquiliarum TaxID=1549639 RepID=A0A839GLH5_9BACT|nr:Ig-like domain-containing protein [Rufibacter quisquiliarum]MBA9075826.1 gliding motility-associated-like protein [Rufibacter quisquiliarum]
MKRLLLLCSLMLLSAYGATAQVLFSQDFNDPSKTSPADYLAADPNNPNAAQFSGLISANTTNVISVTDGKLRFAKSIAGNMAFTRTNISEAPKFVKFEVDLTVSNNAADEPNAASFNFATNLATGLGSPGNSAVHSKIMLYLSATDGYFTLVPVGSTTIQTPDKLFHGTQRITWLDNRSGAEVSYIGPDHKAYTLANDASDTWVGTTRIADLTGLPARVPSQDITSLKFTITAGAATLDFDNFLLTKMPLAVPTGSVSINSGAVATNNTAVTLAITSKNAAQMKFSNDGNTWSDYEPMGTSKLWSIPAGEGTKTVFMKLKDSNGVESVQEIKDDIIFDVTAPAAPSIPDLLASDDSGPSDTDNETNFIKPTFAGTAEAGSTVKVYAGTVEIGSGTANANGEWVIKSSVELANGTYEIKAKVIDLAGNEGPLSSALLITIKAGPTVAITSSATISTNAPFTLTFTFSEEVAGFAQTDLVITNGVASNFTVVNGTTYTVLITPQNNAEVTVGIPADAAQNPLTNNGNNASDTFKILFDNIAPTVALTTPGTEYVKGPFTVTFTFNEPVTAFEQSDITLTNATASAFTKVSDKVYSILVTPIVAGEIKVSVAANVAQDLANNANTGSTVLSKIYDIVSPGGYAVAFMGSRIDGITSLSATLRVTGAEHGATYNYAITSSGGGTEVKGSGTAATSQFDITGIDLKGLKDGVLTVTFSQTDLAGNKGANVTATVTKVIPNVKAVANVSPISVPVRTIFTILPLPAQVEVEYSTGEVEMTPVTWAVGTYNGYHSGKYTLKGTVTPNYGGTNTSNLFSSVEVIVSADFSVANLFTPNGDGKNDTWIIPDLSYYKEVVVEVFDREGVRLFHTTDPAKGWDGRNLNGKVIAGPYFYVIRVASISSVKKGVVTVIKD